MRANQWGTFELGWWRYAQDIREFVPETPVVLEWFAHDMRCARRAEACGLERRVSHKTWNGHVVWPGIWPKHEDLSKLRSSTTPQEALRGIVVGDIVRRLMGRTVARPVAPTARLSREPHALHPCGRGVYRSPTVVFVPDGCTRATALSVDTISAHDLTSRETMLGGSRAADGGDAARPSVTFSCAEPASCVLERTIKDCTPSTQVNAESFPVEQHQAPRRVSLFSTWKHV